MAPAIVESLPRKRARTTSWIGLRNLGDGDDFLPHCLEGDVLVRIDVANEQPVVLLRKEAFWNDYIQPDGQRHDADQRRQSQPVVPERRVQSVRIEGLHPVKDAV